MTVNATPGQVLALLKSGCTIADAERRTGWPAGAVRKLVDKHGWQVEGGRVVQAKPIGLAVLVEAKRRDRNLTLQQVADQIGIGRKALHNLLKGQGSERSREQVAAWLQGTPATGIESSHVEAAAPNPAKAVAAVALHATVRARLQQRGQSWRQAAREIPLPASTLHGLASGRLSERTEQRLKAWLAETD
ncbi:hypothetical protein SAMN05421505_1498 [Sinosporangium album]|uniref:Uncharacterized protein n=1 Tax=Sinosporangium album TaxID=504805 RepID=A0A1G8KAM2_9ACTN|nr:hypothetical protein [Sinosporangium album]SDI40474.1 hypothetical protein SAMN05421505_1498 [Sinosporangium album]